MRIRDRGALTAFICATALAVVAAQGSTNATPVPQNAPKPLYTPDTMLRRIAAEQNAAPAAQRQGPGAEQNAALGYWMAFAQMKEMPVGGSARDTDALLDANAAALATLARATRMTACDWGIDYALGPNAPIAHLPKARALARVNSAAAVRAMGRGRGDEAVDQWLVGMRFARHIESGGTLIATLTAWNALRNTWSGLEPWVVEKKLSAAQRSRLADAVRMLPETVFHWDTAVLNEARVLQVAAQSATSGGGSAAPPTEAETKRFLREIERVGDAFTRSPDETAVVIAAYMKETDVHRFYRESMPSLTKTNETRREVKAERERLLALLK